MERFIACHNLARFRRLLDGEQDETTRIFLKDKVFELQRQIALMDADTEGVGGDPAAKTDERAHSLHELDHELRDRFRRTDQAYLLIDPRAGLHIVDANIPYARATMVTPERIVGDKLFRVFPDNPARAHADGVCNLYNSLKTAAETGRRHDMGVQRHDVRTPEGDFVERYWKASNSPIFDFNRRLRLLLHRVEDVTRDFLGGASSAPPPT